MIDEMARQYVVAHHSGLGTAFTQAVHRIEVRLTDDPLAGTESRSGSVRVIIESPVTLYFRIESAAARVTVLGIRFNRPRAR